MSLCANLNPIEVSLRGPNTLFFSDASDPFQLTGGPLRGYIAMLATKEEHRGRGIASKLVRLAVEKMIEKDADEVSTNHSKEPKYKVANSSQIALETEIDNIPSLRIYENLGFLRTKRLHRYYLNGNTAFRLVLYLKPGIPYRSTYPPEYLPEYEVDASGSGLMSEDLMTRQAAQIQLEDVENERHDITGSSR